MAIRRPFDSDPEVGLVETFHYDETTGEFFLENEQDVSDVVADNKAHFNEKDERARWSRGVLGGDRVASIPNVLWAELEAKGITQDEKALKRWLNDPDNRAFRVRPGKV